MYDDNITVLNKSVVYGELVILLLVSTAAWSL